MTDYDLSVSYASAGGSKTATINRPEASFSYGWESGWKPDSDVEYALNGQNTYFAVFSPDGRRREYYNAQNRLESVWNSNGTVLYSLTYSSASTPISIAPVSGLLIKVSNPFGQSLNFTYDSLSRLKTMADPSGGLHQYGYDSWNNLISVTRPDGRIRQYLYNEAAHTQGTELATALTGIIDENGVRLATFGYDSEGRAVLTEHAGGVDRHQVSYGTPPQLVWEIVRDAANVPRYVRTYYSHPQGVVVTDALGQERNYSFTSLHGSVRAIGSDKVSNGQCSAIPLTRTHDVNGNVNAQTDFNGNATTYSFDTLRNIETSRTEAVGASAIRTVATQWHYAQRWPTEISTYESSTATGTPKLRTTLAYDNGGNVTTRTEADLALNNSRTSSYTYTTYGQRLTDNGPRTDVSDLTTYTYYNCTTGYGCGQVNTITNALGQVTTYNTYNAHGQPLTITDPNGVITTLTYDLRQRLLSRTVGMEQTGFDYWPTGLLKKATLPDGSYLEYTYDAAHRLTEINDAQGNRMVYTLDAMGNRTKEEAFDSSLALSRTRSQVFNTLNQLSQQIAASGAPSVTTTFGYDNNGNQTSINAPLGRNTTQSYDELNRLTSVADPESGLTQYGYNALDQLISVTDPRGLATTYTYNGLGDLKQQVSCK